MKNVSLKAIAAELGVSINTVSHALRDMDDISKEMKSKIRKKAIEMGYMPNRVSQTMKKDENPVVAIIINSFYNLYFNTLYGKLMEQFSAHNEYDFLLLFAPSNENEADVIKQCILQRVDLIVTHQALNPDIIELARLNNIQIITIGSFTDESVDNITVDEVYGCTLAARYLMLFGMDKLVYVGSNYPLSDYRFSLFNNEVKKAGGGEVFKFNVETDDVSELYSLIFNGYRKIFFYNDELAYDILARLDKLVVDIRKMYPDLHLVGFDGLCEEISGLKQLTTVKIDFTEFARETYRAIKNRLENPDMKFHRITLPVSLHQRNKNDR